MASLAIELSYVGVVILVGVGLSAFILGTAAFPLVLSASRRVDPPCGQGECVDDRTLPAMFITSPVASTIRRCTITRNLVRVCLGIALGGVLEYAVALC